jgi:hypothetical protein
MGDTPLHLILPPELVRTILLTYLPQQYAPETRHTPPCRVHDDGDTTVYTAMGICRLFPLNPQLVRRCAAMLKNVLKRKRRYINYRYESVAWMAATLRPFYEKPVSEFLNSTFDTMPALEMQQLLTKRRLYRPKTGVVQGYYRLLQYTRVSMVKVGYRLVDAGYLSFRMEWIVWYGDKPVDGAWPNAHMPCRRRLNSDS